MTYVPNYRDSALPIRASSCRQILGVSRSGTGASQSAADGLCVCRDYLLDSDSRIQRAHCFFGGVNTQSVSANFLPSGQPESQ
jgi:fermentation-respiration switch protein FrsA (DUF1100 family)